MSVSIPANIKDLSPKEWALIVLVEEKDAKFTAKVMKRAVEDVSIASVWRKSKREFDVCYEGRKEKYLFGSWLPLALLNAINWTKYTEHGDWSEVRDAGVENIWVWFESERRKFK